MNKRLLNCKIQFFLPAVFLISAFLLSFACCPARSFAKSNSVKKTGAGGKTDKSKPLAGPTEPYLLKRNPFQTFLYTQKNAASFKSGELPLLRYGISSLKVVGIMERRGRYFAMIQTPNNRSYIITVGSLVGVNRAIVLSINSSEVYLTENSRDVLGQMHSTGIVMRLK